MKESEQIYHDLRKHLDNQAVGFPATKSGAEIRILKRLFTPEEAEMAMHLTYRPCSLGDFYSKVKPEGMTLSDAEQILEGMRSKGAIGHINKENKRYYLLIPFVVGSYEFQLGRLTREFIDDVTEYMNDRNFGLALLGTKISQMRTIPVQQSITVEHRVTSYDNVRELIAQTEGPIAINECICRQLAEMNGKPCQTTTRRETCMCFDEWAEFGISEGVSRKISKEEALEIMRQSEEEGLVLQPSNDKKVEFICACCGCCCGMLSMQKMLPKPVDFWATNFYSVIDAEKCNGCGTCVARCQVNAVKVNGKTGIAVIDLDRCIGCGNCVITCPSEAISLVKKEKETVPPDDVESLYKTLAENKLGTLGKIKLISRMVLKK
ncbi:MAG: 4Fe-4S binding protein [Dehalococcoidia bacterium]|jgi:NAD-dependent dihydropyrimidine dehydrogenase PreA subunit